METETSAMEMEAEEELILPSSFSSDICETLITRYAKSSAPQHRHLVATAAAMRTILKDESLPQTPPAYFAAAISTVQNTLIDKQSDPTAVGALTSFLSILLPLIPSESLSPPKSCEAARVIISLLQAPSKESLPASTVRSLVKTLGCLLKLCDSEDWSEVKLPFEILLKFVVDKRPKVRKCAQVCTEEVLKSFECSKAVKKGSKMVLSFFRGYMDIATELVAIRATDGSKCEIMTKPEHLEVLHLLNTLKFILPTLSEKVTCKLLPELAKLLDSHFSPLTRHVFDVLEMVFQVSKLQINVAVAEEIIASLVSYVSSSENNPLDTLLFASTLLKCAMEKLHVIEPNIWIKNLPQVFSSIAGFLKCEAEAARRAADILKDLTGGIDGKILLDIAKEISKGRTKSTSELTATKSICDKMETILDSFHGIPNEHALAVISHLFLKLGSSSYFLMKEILLKLSDRVKFGEDCMTGKQHLQDCIGSAIMAMGPEKILTLIPLSLHSEELTCSNIWLIPILKKYVSGASLKFFMEHIVPLAKSVQRAINRVKKSRLLEDLQISARGLWELLPAFCCYPTDTFENFEPLANLLMVVLKEDSFSHKAIGTALVELVNQNKGFLRGSSAKSKDLPPHYSKKVASRNMKALRSSSMDLLEALADIFFASPHEKRVQLKEAIGCLASIIDSSKIRSFFLSLLEKYHLMDRETESEKAESLTHETRLIENGDVVDKIEQQEAQWSAVMELASSLVEGADEGLINTLFHHIRVLLQGTDGIGRREAYYALSRIFAEHHWFYSSHLDELMTLLLGVKSDGDVMSMKSRLSCFHFLLVHLLKSDSEEVDEKAFFILNEIILALKDSKKEAREAAYDILTIISSNLKSSDLENSGASLHRLFSMIMGYLSGSSPQIMSGAVSALSLLIYKDPTLCFSLTDLLPSILVLLQSKALEVIKAVLGFMKVLVSCLPANDLQRLQSDIVNGILPWSSVSKNHFRSKVRIIMEIVIRKCGFDSVDLVVPKKYKGFIKTVVEQRQGKGVESFDVTKPGDSSTKWSELFKFSGDLLVLNSGENGSRASSMAGKEDKRRKFTGRISTKTEPSNAKSRPSNGSQWSKTKQSKGQPRRKENRGEGLNRKPSSGRDAKMDQKKKDSRQSSNAGRTTFSPSSKSHKFKRSGKPQRRTK